MAKADCIVNFILPGPLLSLEILSERRDKGGTICSRVGEGGGGPGMAAIFGLGVPLILLRTVQRDRFEGGPSMM